MSEVYIAAAAADAAPAEALAQRLRMLRVAVACDPAAGRQEILAAIRTQLQPARAVVVLYSNAGRGDEIVQLIASYAKQSRKLIALKMPGTLAPPGLGNHPAIELDEQGFDPQAGPWLAFLRDLSNRLGRKGLVAFERLHAMKSSAAYRGWAKSHAQDPLAETALALAARIEEEAARKAAARAEEGSRAMEDIGGFAPAAWRRLARFGAFVIGRDRRTRLVRAGLAAGLGALAGVVASQLRLEETEAPALYADARLDASEGTSAQHRPAAPAALARGTGEIAPAAPDFADAAAVRAPAEPDPVAADPDLAAARAAARAAADAARGSVELALQAAARADAAGERPDDAAPDAIVFVQGAPEGGGFYRGEWRGGRPDGFGVSEHDDGAVFAGATAQGHGETQLSGGARFRGRHADGRPSGPGIVVYPDGRIFEGRFDGRRQGHGVLWSADGTVLESGVWRDDVLVRAIPFVAAG